MIKKCGLELNFSFMTCMAICNAVVHCVERYFEFKLLVEYHKCKDDAWFGLTAFSMLLPGPVMAMVWTAHAMKRKRNENLEVSPCLILSVAASLMLWPISSVVWYVKNCN